MFGTRQQSRRNFQCWFWSLASTVFDSVLVLFVHFFIVLFVLLLFFLRLASFCSDFTISNIETCKWIKESLWKIREAINEVGACSLGLWAGILWRPQKYLFWFKCDIKRRRERYLINNSLQLGLRRYLSSK